MKSTLPYRWQSGILILAALGLPAGIARADAALDTAVNNAFTFSTTRLNATVSFLEAKYPSNYLTSYPSNTYTSTSGSNIIGTWKVAQDYNSVTSWIDGFFPGTLWQMYAKSGDPTMLANAKAWTAGLEVMDTTPIDHDMGFRFMTSFYNAYTLSTDATDPGGVYRAHARSVLLTAAAALDTRFNMGGIPVGAIKSEDYGSDSPYPVYTDSMMNISLLFAGWDLSGRPTTGQAKTWYDHAVTQANTILAQNVRSFGPTDPRAADDGSTYHIVKHNDGSVQLGVTLPTNGAVYTKMTAQGYGDETTWSRGQAWALYGYTTTYRYTKGDPSVDPAHFLEAAKRTANYFISHLPNNYAADPYNHVTGDFVSPTDFDAALGEPVGPYNDANNDHVYGDRKPALLTFTRRDSSAAAIAASGLFDLSTLADNQADRDKYFTTAQAILNCLLTFKGSDNKLDYLAADSVDMGILSDASGAWNSPTGSYIFGDYYLLEAMNRYQAIEAVPEPASLVLLGVGGVMILSGRRGRRGRHGRRQAA